MKAESAFIRPDGAVELHTEATVHLYAPRIIHPRYTEFDDPLGLHKFVDDASGNEFRALLHDRLEGFQHLRDCLMELGLSRVPGDDLFHDRL